MPWIDTGSHIGTICDTLARTGVEPHAWTAGGLLDAIEIMCRQYGVTVINPTAQRNPVGYLAWMIRRTITLDPDGDRTRARARKAEQAAREARRQAELAADRDRGPILTRTELAALRATSDAQIAALNHARTTIVHRVPPRLPDRQQDGRSGG